HMVNGANWFDRTVSADAAGIILTSLVINRQLWRHIEFHPECNAIYAALD
ncbi:antirestriction protein, partial [Shigella sonnei]